MIYDNLPDDILDYIYTKIIYNKNKEFCLEIKIYYFITNYLFKKKSLKDIYCCLLIHNNNDITIDEINNLSYLVQNYDNNLLKLYILNILKKMNIDSKLEFLFNINDYTIDFKNFDKLYINNRVIKTLNNFVFKL